MRAREENELVMGIERYREERGKTRERGENGVCEEREGVSDGKREIGERWL